MRFLHVSDLHIGKRLSEFSLADDQRHILSAILDVVRTRKADALLVAGDVYDKSAPSADAVALVDFFLARAAALGVPTFVSSGNHDSAERVAYGSSLFAQRNVMISPVYDGTVAHYTLEDEFGPVTFWLIPFLRPATVRAFFPEAHIDSYTDALRTVIEACDIDTAQRNVALAHQFVTAGGSAPEMAGSEVSVGGLDNVDASVFDTFDYVALGHIHRPQRVGRDEVRYSGSPLKYSIDEASHHKSAPLVELGPKGEPARIELVDMAPLHDVRMPRCTLDELCAPETLAAADPNDYVYAVLTDERETVEALPRLRACYPRLLGFRYENTRSKAAGLQGQTASLDSNRSPLEHFEEFFERQVGAPMSEEQRSIVVDELEKLGVM